MQKLIDLNYKTISLYQYENSLYHFGYFFYQNHEKEIEMYIFKLCAAILQDLCHFKTMTFGPLKCSHTQLNVCEKEELSCFLYLIQIFGFKVGLQSM